MWPVLAMGPGRQAGQAGIGQPLPQPPDRGISLVVKVHLDCVSHVLTMPDEPPSRNA
jgi:hypothetical protein